RRPDQLTVLRALAAWREREAHHRDMPRQRVLKDESLIEIAKQLPTTMEGVLGIRNLRRMSDRTAGMIADTVAAALNGPLDQPQAHKRRDTTPDPDLVGMLSLLLKIRCRDAEVSPKLVACRTELEQLVAGEDVHALHGWRHEVFGRY